MTITLPHRPIEMLLQNTYTIVGMKVVQQLPFSPNGHFHGKLNVNGMIQDANSECQQVQGRLPNSQIII